MKADACLYATLEPMTSRLPLHSLCKKDIRHPVIIGCWNDIPLGTRLDMEQFVGICAKCRNALKEREEHESLGKHILYAVRNQEMTENG